MRSFERLCLGDVLQTCATIALAAHELMPQVCRELERVQFKLL